MKTKTSVRSFDDFRIGLYDITYSTDGKIHWRVVSHLFDLNAEEARFIDVAVYEGEEELSTIWTVSFDSIIDLNKYYKFKYLGTKSDLPEYFI